LSAPEYRPNPHVQTVPIHLHDLSNFDGNFGRAKTFLHQLNTFLSQRALFPDDRHKMAYAVSLLIDKAAEWAMGFAASPQGYLFNS
jgi:hypothetical protein